jgi:hypothetical protein
MATILMAAAAVAGALVYSLCVCSARECVPVLNHAESPATAIEKRAFRVCTLGKDCRAKGVELDTKERRESAPEKQEHLSPEPLLPCYSTNWKAGTLVQHDLFFCCENFEAHCYNIAMSSL